MDQTCEIFPDTLHFIYDSYEHNLIYMYYRKVLTVSQNALRRLKRKQISHNLAKLYVNLKQTYCSVVEFQSQFCKLTSFGAWPNQFQKIYS